METPRYLLLAAGIFGAMLGACVSEPEPRGPDSDMLQNTRGTAYAVSKEFYDAVSEIDPADPQWLETLLQKIPPPSNSFDECINSVLPLLNTGDELSMRLVNTCSSRHPATE